LSSKFERRASSSAFSDGFGLEATNCSDAVLAPAKSPER